MSYDKTIKLSFHDLGVLLHIVLCYVEDQRKLLNRIEKDMKKGKEMPYVPFTDDWDELYGNEETYLNMAKSILKDIQKQTEYVCIAEEALEKI